MCEKLTFVNTWGGGGGVALVTISTATGQGQGQHKLYVFTRTLEKKIKVNPVILYR